MNRKNFFLFRFIPLVTMLLQGFSVFSQDTIPQKDSVIIIADPENKIAKLIVLDAVPIRYSISAPGLTIDAPDSIQQSRYNSGTLTDLLGQNGITFLKSYGNGNLATTTIRGASASQTPVFWNGINLQSPTNGNVDLSLMPAILCDDVWLQNGGGSAGWGSGAIGGVIQTGNRSSFNDGLRIKYCGELGSFGESNHGIKIGYANSRFYTDVRAYRQIAGNNFTYRDISLNGSPIDTLHNSWFFNRGIMGEAGWNTKSQKHFFVIRTWYQTSDRGIPPSMLETNYDERQQDQFFRTMGNWKMYFHKVDLEIKSAVLMEYMDFYLGYNLPNSFTHAISFVNEADCRITYNAKLSNTFGINDTQSKADVTQNVPVTTQNRASVFVATKYVPNEFWNFVLNFRDEEVQGKMTPLVGSLGVEYYRIKNFIFKTSISRNYRIPTFNDLYWTPGGNPDLKPEDSWNEDGTVVFNYGKKNFEFEYSATAYYRITKNWILWQPSDANSAIWSPENLLEVWSRGFEHRLKFIFKKNKFDFKFIGGYDYIRATNEKSKNPYDVTIGKQLTYVPANHFYGMVQIAYMKFYLAYTHQFNGLRFTTSDHSEYLPAYDIADLTIGKRIDYKKSYADIYFRVNNIFNTEYQVIAWRPMPGINYQLGITIDFNKPKKVLSTTTK